MLLRDEFVYHDLQNAWFVIYRAVAQIFLDKNLNEGSTILRNTIKKYGNHLGRVERASSIENNEKPNLYTYFWKSSNKRCPDPRTKIQVQFLREDEAVYKVLACPMYSFMQESNEVDLMLPFCEEFTECFLKSYCGETCQSNLSEKLIEPRESFCCFSHYLRATNMENSKGVFSEEPEEIPLQQGSKQLLAIPGIDANHNLAKAQAAYQVYVFFKSLYEALGSNNDKLFIKIVSECNKQLLDYLSNESNHYKRYDFADFLKKHSFVFDFSRLLDSNDSIRDSILEKYLLKNLPIN